MPAICIKGELERPLWERLVPLARDVRTINWREFTPKDRDHPGRGNGPGRRYIEAGELRLGVWCVIHGIVLVGNAVTRDLSVVSNHALSEAYGFLAGPGDLVNLDGLAQRIEPAQLEPAYRILSLEVVTPTARVAFLPWPLLEEALRKDALSSEHSLTWAVAAAVARRAAMQPPALWLCCPPYSELNYTWLLAHYVVALGVPPMTPVTIRSCLQSFLATMTTHRLDNMRHPLDLLCRAGAIAFSGRQGCDDTIRRRSVSLMVTVDAWREITHGGVGGGWDNAIAVLATRSRLLRQFPRVTDVLQAP